MPLLRGRWVIRPVVPVVTISMKGLTRSGSNCVPLPLMSSAIASASVRPLRYGRSWVIAANASASAMIRPSERNLGPRLAVGIARAVPALVMVGNRRQHVVEMWHAFDHEGAEHHVLTDHLHFAFGQPPGFAQYRVRHRDFADIVQLTGDIEGFDLLRRQTELLAKPHREIGHFVRVVLRVAILAIDGAHESAQRAKRGGFGGLRGPTEHANLATAGVLRRIHGGVGIGDEFLPSPSVFGKGRHSDREAHRQFLIVNRDFRVLHPLNQATGYFVGDVVVRTRKLDEKLIAAIPGHPVPASHTTF